MSETLPKRKHPRLKHFDYSQNMRYFITICTHKKRCILSSVRVGRGLAPAETHKTAVGQVIERTLLEMPKRYPYLIIDKYVVMPNHIHVIFGILAPAGASPRPTISDIVCAFKSLSTRECKSTQLIDNKLWQTSFYDHIVRNETDYRAIWEYIDTNPTRWADDKYYSEGAAALMNT